MNFKAIFKGTILSFAFVCLCLIISAVLVYYNIISERTASIVFFASAIVGVFFTSYGTARANDEKILINSMSVGILFCIILLILSAITNGGLVLHTRTLALMAGVIASAFAGVLFGK